MTLPAKFFHLMHEKGNLSALWPDTRKYCLAVGVFCFRAGNGIPLDCGQPSDKSVMYETAILVQAARVNEKGNCGLSLFTCCSK